MSLNLEAAGAIGLGGVTAKVAPKLVTVRQASRPLYKRGEPKGRPSVFLYRLKADGAVSETIVAMRDGDRVAPFVDCRLNILGVRVWESSCQLIARTGKEWGTIGPRWDLPVHVPEDAEELKMAAAEPLRLTAYQYCAECPGSDLAEVLRGTKNFAAALAAAAVPIAKAVTEPTAPL